MLTDPATVAAARAGDKDALVGILGALYPQVWRMAINLTGRLEPGKEVARNIMRQSLSAAEGWEHDEAPTIWFRHHTVLATREAAPDRHPIRVDEWMRDGRVAVRHVMVEGLGHAWSGGDDRHPFADPQGPDALALFTRFAAEAAA